MNIRSTCWSPASSASSKRIITLQKLPRADCNLRARYYRADSKRSGKGGYTSQQSCERISSFCLQPLKSKQNHVQSQGFKCVEDESFARQSHWSRICVRVVSNYKVTKRQVFLLEENLVAMRALLVSRSLQATNMRASFQLSALEIHVHSTRQGLVFLSQTGATQMTHVRKR